MAAVCRAFIVVALVTVAGCGPAKPTYSQALQDYKTELDLLDRMEAKQAAYEAEAKANAKEIFAMLIQLPENEQRPYREKLDAENKKREGILAEENLRITAQRERVQAASAALKSVEPKKPEK